MFRTYVGGLFELLCDASIDNGMELCELIWIRLECDMISTLIVDHLVL